ncbi:transmembrane protein, putative (macronuclear) [Tetrahymena thermophila SB210]|uniref:Transmembrane protein, putative n=1 Tax=Tetrahymena thermophila (strain SB210) TaxID=312017 RepID=W7X373_TETTS|nr:transmembrane protein, putative [Tetrahymena thermophila SB210]EWS71887.1 transmembrane protein, putative [Tetrahymena thermophila SB210]|eukprot:XP_012655581.1 transmembrane protein, putative [Tetrahymena thermophila SB210]
MLINNISNNSRIAFSQLRNIIGFGYLFCNLYTQHISIQLIQGDALTISFIILTILINLIAFWIAYDKPVELPYISMRMKIFIKGVFFFLHFNIYLDNYIVPIYNKALSKYYQNVNTLPFKVYRLLKFLKISICLLLSYLLNTSNFEKQTHYLSSLLIFGVYFAFSICFILYDIITIKYPSTINISFRQNNTNQDILNNNSQYKYMIPSKTYFIN